MRRARFARWAGAVGRRRRLSVAESRRRAAGFAGPHAPTVVLKRRRIGAVMSLRWSRRDSLSDRLRHCRVAGPEASPPFRVSAAAARPQARRETEASMATKTTEREETERRRRSSETDGPLLDLTDAAVKRMIKLAKKRGYVTYDELNEVLPSEEFSSEQIEDVLGQLTEMGINVVESEEAEEGRRPRAAGADAADDDEGEGGELVEPRADAGRRRARDARQGADRPHRRSGADVPARDGLGRAALARGRDRHRQAHRGRPRGDDRRASARAR